MSNRVMSKISSKEEIRDAICGKLRKLASIGTDKPAALSFRETQDGGALNITYPLNWNSDRISFRIASALEDAGVLQGKKSDNAFEYTGHLPLTPESLEKIEKVRTDILTAIPEEALRNAFALVSPLVEEQDDTVKIGCDSAISALEILRPIRG